MTKMAGILRCFVALLLSVYIASGEDAPDCKCDNPVSCHPVESWNKGDREVIITTAGGKDDYTNWIWDSITTVLQLKDGYNNDLMCYTHSKGRKYGFIIDMLVNYDVNSTDMVRFINTTLPTDIRMHNADVLALDLLNLLGQCNNTENHIDQIVKVVSTTIIKTRKTFPKLKILCVMPWKPPCYEYNCGVTPALQQHCDAMIINPDSFISYCSESCRARATVPFTKLFVGLDEYLTSGVTLDQIIIGVPWYGYNYSCEIFSNNSMSEADHLCTLKTKMENRTVGNETKQIETCDFEGSRKKVKLGEFYDTHPSLLMDTTIYSRTQQAPSITGKDAQNKTHMIWYEDFASLSAKYAVIYHHDVKGCLVYTGDDLSKSKLKTGKEFNTEMFAWLLHTLLASSTHEYTKDTRNVAGLVAGVGIGMFVLGVLLGLIIACIRFRQKQTLQPPFKKDFHKIDYHDEEPDL